MPFNSSIARKWGFVDALDPKSEMDLAALEKEMSKFYSSLALELSYWELAESNNQVWKDNTHPYHYHLLSLVESNSTLVDFGCGSAHVLGNLNRSNNQAINYIGIELSESQVRINCQKYPNSQFICGDIAKDHKLDQIADWAISLFAIEHCVRPHLLLQRMYQSLKPGGKLAIICPSFTHTMPSIRSGFRATTKTSKLRQVQLLDFLYSLYQEKKTIPDRVKYLNESSFLFPIYLYPRCLESPYYSDNDAVALVIESKVAKYLEHLGLQILCSSSTFAPSIDSTNSILYLVAEKVAFE